MPHLSKSSNDMNASIASMVKAALDFLRRSIYELKCAADSGETDQLKYSVMHFHAAMESLLKARLLSEHWSLLFKDMQKISMKNFKSGDFISVGFRDAIKRVRGLSRTAEPFSNTAKNFFEAIAQYRNRIIHFPPAQDTKSEAQNIIKAQLHAWYHLRNLCDKWEFMASYTQDVAGVDSQYRDLRKYLTVIYDNIKKEIRKLKRSGMIFQKCPHCDFPAVNHGKKHNVIHRARCMVCDFSAQSLLIECDKCGKIVSFYDEGFAKCRECGSSFEPKHLIEMLAWKPMSKDDLLEYTEAGCCTECDNHAVVRLANGGWACLGCFLVANASEVHFCGYCSAPYIGEHNPMTYHFGCGMCDGSDKD